MTTEYYATDELNFSRRIVRVEAIAAVPSSDGDVRELIVTVRPVVEPDEASRFSPLPPGIESYIGASAMMQFTLPVHVAEHLRPGSHLALSLHMLSTEETAAVERSATTRRAFVARMRRQQEESDRFQAAAMRMVGAEPASPVGLVDMSTPVATLKFPSRGVLQPCLPEGAAFCVACDGRDLECVHCGGRGYPTVKS